MREVYDFVFEIVWKKGLYIWVSSDKGNVFVLGSVG